MTWPWSLASETTQHVVSIKVLTKAKYFQNQIKGQKKETFQVHETFYPCYENEPLRQKFDATTLFAISSRCTKIWNLTLSHTTNFRLFQTERVCRRQFRSWWKWWNVHHRGRKHCGKRKNCLLQAISSFPNVFKRFVLQTQKKPGLVWERVKRYEVDKIYRYIWFFIPAVFLILSIASARQVAWPRYIYLWNIFKTWLGA